MKQLLLLSHGSMPNQHYLAYARPWIEEHFSASPKARKTILFVAYAVKNQDDFADKAAVALAPLGIDIISAHNVPDPIAALEKVDGVFVGGGNTFRLLDRMQKSGLLEAVKKKVEAGMPYMGASAGINIVAPTIMTTNDMPIMGHISLDGIDLVPFQLNPHYVSGKFYHEEEGHKVPYNGKTRTRHIREFHEENNTPVVGLPGGAALRIRGNTVELLGGKPVTIFRKGIEPVEVNDGKALSQLMCRHERMRAFRE